MELGESVQPPSVVAELRHQEDSCPFCAAMKSEPAELENELVAHHDEDVGPDAEDGPPVSGWRFKNDASKLGTNLIAAGEDADEAEVQLPGRTKQRFPVTQAAHHLIPGNAAFDKCKFMKEKDQFLRSDGMAAGNIGYNINSAANGVWLPGNYGVRPWGTKGAAFQAAEGVAPVVYAGAAMRTLGRQFHDAHKQYSDFVLQVLDTYHEAVEEKQAICEESSADPEAGSRNLTTLVPRFQHVSRRMKGYLLGSPSGWVRNIYTSSQVLDWAETLP